MAALIGYWFGGGGAALLSACGGLIFGWAIHKGAVFAGFRGALLGAGFAMLVGPGADFLFNDVPFDEKLVPAVIVGSLVGSLLGVRNFRKRRTKSAPVESSDADAHQL